MAAAVLPEKLVQPANSHLTCGICKLWFRDPVISTSCGHTYCKACISSSAASGDSVKCPIDGLECQPGATVPNRALQSQIEDLEIYCKNGLKWSPSAGEYTVDPQGCKEIIKLGSRYEHEEICPFNEVPCPNSVLKCGKFRKGKLEKHLLSCPFFACHHQDKGCSFLGRQDEINWHNQKCGYRPEAKVSAIEVEELRLSNRKLEETVAALNGRVAELENRNNQSDEQLSECLSALKSIESRYTDIHDKLDRLLKVQRTPSKRNSTNSQSTVIARSPSTSTLTSQFWSRVETWTMPFQFKCIGTLRSHRGAVRSLCAKNNQLFSAGNDSIIKVWELDELAKGHRMNLAGHTDAVLVLCSGDRLLYSAGADKTIRAWDIETGEQELIVEHHLPEDIVAMVCTDSFVFASTFSAIHIWDANTLDETKSITGLHHWVRALALNYGRDKLYSGSHNMIEIWDTLGKFTLKGKIIHKFGTIYSLVVTSSFLIAGTYNQNIQLFDVNTQNHLRALTGHLSAVTCLQVSPSSRYLFSSSTDSTIIVWNLENNLPIQSLTRHETAVNSIALHGDLLLSGAEDNELKVFKHFSLL